jgi:hypothetical protein
MTGERRKQSHTHIPRCNQKKLMHFESNKYARNEGIKTVQQNVMLALMLSLLLFVYQYKPLNKKQCCMNFMFIYSSVDLKYIATTHTVSKL